MNFVNHHINAMHFIHLESEEMSIGDLQGDKYHKLYLKTFDNNFEEELDSFLNVIKDSLTEEKPEILFFVHGMWESMPVYFRSDCAYLENNYVKNPQSPIGAVVLVTWNASPLLYRYVRRNALNVVAPFQVVLDAIQTFKMKNASIPVNLLAHSIGNRILLEALDKEYPELFDKMMLSAPDIQQPSEENNQNYLHLVKVARQILLVQNKKDKSLYMSAFANRAKRLGRVGFEQPFANNINTIEVSSYRDLDKIEARFSDHLHFKYNEDTRKLMVDFLKNGFKD